MSKLKDLTGQRFGKLLVIERAKENTKHGRARWLCKCECGKEIITSGNCLLQGHAKSCGCSAKDNKSLYKHGLSQTRIHYIWRAMKDRCYNPNNSHYYLYGGRGITICNEWLNDFMSFYNWSMNNGYSENLTIDRIENDKSYSPNNCRWATDIVQSNNKRNNKLFTHNGESKSLAEWCRIFGIKYTTVQSRLNHGYSFEESISPNFKKKDIFKSEDNRKLHELCKLRGISYKLVIQRINSGWELERALTEPSHQSNK